MYIYRYIIHVAYVEVYNRVTRVIFKSLLKDIYKKQKTKRYSYIPLKIHIYMKYICI